MPDSLISTKEEVAVLKVTTDNIKDDINEIKANQKVILEFITEQKTGRKIVWILFGAAATIVAIAKDFGQIFTSFFHR